MIILAYGLPAMGKTTLMHDLIRAHPDHRFFVVDHSKEWGPDAGHWRGHPPETLEIVYKGKPFPEFQPSGVYVFRGFEGREVASLLLQMRGGVYVDDEIDVAARRKGWDNSPLRTIVHQGRHIVGPDDDPEEDSFEAHIIGACRRPQNLHTDITDIASEIYVFRLKGNRTLKRLLDDSLIDDDEWDMIRELPPFHFKHDPSGKYMSVPKL